MQRRGFSLGRGQSQRATAEPSHLRSKEALLDNRIRAENLPSRDDIKAPTLDELEQYVRHLMLELAHSHYEAIREADELLFIDLLQVIGWLGLAGAKLRDIVERERSEGKRMATNEADKKSKAPVNPA